ncbi:hypothetical protein GGH96_000338 [Coemansia sp. RSA 1972]|nr:hypothetical protein GGH96_000338 [Coemansia sp. RSA 1972]
MFVRAFSLLAIAALACASPVHVRNGDAVPSDIAFVVAQVAEVIEDPKYASLVSEAASNLINVHGLPEQESAGASIMSSLLGALSSQNDPDVATAMAADFASLLNIDDIPTEVEDLAKSMVSVLEDPKANDNVADNINQMFSFIESVRVALPELYEDEENEDGDEGEDVSQATGSDEAVDEASGEASDVASDVESDKASDASSKESKDGSSEQSDLDDDVDSESSGASTTIASMLLVTAAKSAGVLAVSTSAGVLAVSARTGVLAVAKITGVLAVSTSAGVLAVSTSAGVLAVAKITGVLSVATSAGVLEAANSAGVLTVAMRATISVVAPASSVTVTVTTTGATSDGPPVTVVVVSPDTGGAAVTVTVVVTIDSSTTDGVSGGFVDEDEGSSVTVVVVVDAPDKDASLELDSSEEADELSAPEAVTVVVSLTVVVHSTVVVTVSVSLALLAEYALLPLSEDSLSDVLEDSLSEESGLVAPYDGLVEFPVYGAELEGAEDSSLVGSSDCDDSLDFVDSEEVSVLVSVSTVTSTDESSVIIVKSLGNVAITSVGSAAPYSADEAGDEAGGEAKYEAINRITLDVLGSLGLASSTSNGVMSSKLCCEDEAALAKDIKATSAARDTACFIVCVKVDDAKWNARYASMEMPMQKKVRFGKLTKETERS